MKKIFALILTLVLAIPLTTAVYAEEQDQLAEIKKDKDFIVVDDDGNGNFSIAAAEGVSQEEFSKKLNSYLSANKVSAAANWTHFLAEAGADMINNESHVHTVFRDYITFTGRVLDTDDVEVDGTSENTYFRRLSSDPVNADLIEASDTCTIAFSGGSLTVSWPPAWQGNSSSSSATINYKPQTKTSSYYHSYNIQGRAVGTLGTISGVTRVSTATFYFGTNSYTATAVDGVNF